MNKPTKVIAIDNKNKRIYETTVSSLEDMQALVGGLIEPVTVGGTQVYVHEEGLFDAEALFFTMDNHLFAGNAFVIGPLDKRGNHTDVNTSVSEIEKRVRLQFGHS